MISFPLTYIVNIKIVDDKYKNIKVETLVIPSKFTPIQQGGIYNLSDNNLHAAGARAGDTPDPK